MNITENTTKEELLANGYITLDQFGVEMKQMIRQNAEDMTKKLEHKRQMENLYYGIYHQDQPYTSLYFREIRR
ncbi:hypothetical protein AGMMS50249_1980 [candidate division SR1 bacterium]|nr:hypothetical protein AGMMS50249_1980 [candidate division SR1 bacterium]